MIVLDYKKFLILEKDNTSHNMILSDSFKNLIIRIDDNISHYLLSLENTENQISYIDITDKRDYISFLQTKSIERIKDENYWNNTLRQELRIGKLLTKLLENKFSKIEIEIFINKYKAQFEFNDYLSRFEIVSGQKMTKFYYKENQIKKGQLLNSCMGGYDQQRFIKSFFESNPDKIKMLILKDKDNPELIIGRANLWYLDSPTGEIYMDRIYTTDDFLVNIFIDYAKLNNYIYKKRQIYGGHVIPVIQHNVEYKLKMSVFLKNLNYNYYPYVDTFQFYNIKTGEITNDTSKWDLTNNGEWIALIHAGGNYLTKNHDVGFKMDYMGRLIHPQFVVWSKMDNCYIHKNDAIYLLYKSDYCIPERELIKIDNDLYLIEDVIYDEEKKIYKKKII